jgi:fatty acid desaturase
MCTYRVIHRLHHNNLYTDEDPDTAIHGGYPRGTAYLWKKRAQDIVGWNAWKTFAYFFGAPAINDQTQRAARPLDDTSPQLRRSARIDRWFVVAFQLLAPLACFALGGWRGLAQYAAFWLVPMLTILQPILRLRAICEHGATTDFSSPADRGAVEPDRRQRGQRARARAPVPASRQLSPRAPSLPAVPHYRLPRLHRLLAEKGALDGAPRCAISARRSS